MSVTIVQGTEITRPATTPLKSSVLDHATVVTNAKFGLRTNDGLWPSYNCLDMLVPTTICPDPLAVKTFGFAEWMPGLEGAVYGGVQCSLVGLDTDDQRREVERVFALAEGRGVEQMLKYNRFVATDSDSPVQWDGPVDVSATGPTGAPAVLMALARLEGYAASLYAGVPTIHMPRAAGTVLEGSGLIVWEGDKAYTKNGSKVAMGGGYDDADMLDSGSWDLYATGEVYVERGAAIRVRQFPILPGFLERQEADVDYDENDDPNLFTDNTMVALAERMTRVAVDCFVAKATATVWA